MRLRPELEAPRPTVSTSREASSAEAFIWSRMARSDSIELDRAVGLARQSLRRRIFERREARGFRVRSNVGQGIDAGSASQRIGRAVHVERHEQCGAERAGRSRRAPRASGSGRRRGSERRELARARRARPRSSRARASVSSFSVTAPDTLRAPGSRPPCPGSITTIGRPGRSALRWIRSPNGWRQLER